MAPVIDLKQKDNLAAFKIALEKAPKAILEQSILEGAQKDDRVAKIFWDALVATDGGSKKKVAKFETCRHCSRGFDITANTYGNCVWHYGNLTIDEEVWVDHYDTIDTRENRKNLPQGFFWDCCGLQLNSEGCMKTEHAPLAVLKRNGRVLKKLETDNERTTARNTQEIHDRNLPVSPPSKKRKLGAGADTKCRGCGELYDESKNTKRVCHWHDLDAVRRFTGAREDWDSDEDGDQCYSENDEDDDDEYGGQTIQWTCCGSNTKEGGCVVTPHLPPRMTDPKVRAIV